MNTIKITFNLKDDVAPGIGTDIPGQFPKRYYSSEDAWPIENSILDAMENERKRCGLSQEEYAQYEVTIFGKLESLLLTYIALDIEKWGNVCLNYIKPGESIRRILPREYRDVRI